jgi:hypothetical protein
MLLMKGAMTKRMASAKPTWLATDQPEPACFDGREPAKRRTPEKTNQPRQRENRSVAVLVFGSSIGCLWDFVSKVPLGSLVFLSVCVCVCDLQPENTITGH